MPGSPDLGDQFPVEYDKVGERYQAGRDLPDSVLDAWRAAIWPFLPSARPLTVLNLGAGTGIFTRAWPRWCACRVVTIEPSHGMRAAAIVAGIPKEAVLVAGVGEALALRDNAVDVAWLFTVFHHLRDPRRCAKELRRVVASNGTVMIGGLFADRGEIGWLPFFPGAETVRSRFPSASATIGLFAETGFELSTALEVESRIHPLAGDAADWARKMRQADSLLNSFDDTEFELGVAALEAAPSEPIVNRLTMLAFTTH
ncbi:MAG: class I SAM-dependent methyltransferase [Acidimicrobiales bacterium]